MILLQNDNANGEIVINQHMGVKFAIHKGKRNYQEDALLVLFCIRKMYYYVQ